MSIVRFAWIGGTLSTLGLILTTALAVPSDAAEGETAASQHIPAEAGALHAYLTSAAYRDFEAKESALHPSAGPHLSFGLPVRVYMNATLDQSLQSGNAQHPAGSGVVKEMYTAEGTLMGWAVAVKTAAESEDGKGWYWYEVTSTDAGASPVASANGAPLCAGCHAGGRDFILSQHPLQ